MNRNNISSVRLSIPGRPLSSTESRAVPQVMELLAGSVESLRQAVGEMEKRLAPVLLPEPPSDAAAPLNAPYVVALAGQIDDKGRAIQSIAYRIQSLLDRLQV